MPRTLHFRVPTREDGAKLWELARKVGLDENSPYSYLMMCALFADTCVLAEEDQNLVGFVTAFRPEGKSDTVFVWQVGVDGSQRGRGVGTAILTELLAREACRTVRYLEATVTPSNQPSQRLFRGMATLLETHCVESDFFGAEMFPRGRAHEAERLFRIGPF